MRNADQNLPAFVVCDVVAEIQAILEDHRSHGTLSPAEVLNKLETLVNERILLRAMWSVGYFPDNTPPAEALH